MVLVLDIKITFLTFFFTNHERKCAIANESRKVVNSKPRVRWCLAHSADPNPQNIGQYINVLSHAGEYASTPVLELLAAHGGDFRCSNALHCAAHGSVGYSMEERIEVLAWLLEKTGIDISQRKHEFSGMNSWRDTMETALHYAVGSNALGFMRFLLEKGIVAGLRDFQVRLREIRRWKWEIMKL